MTIYIAQLTAHYSGTVTVWKAENEADAINYDQRSAVYGRTRAELLANAGNSELTAGILKAYHVEPDVVVDLAGMEEDELKDLELEAFQPDVYDPDDVSELDGAKIHEGYNHRVIHIGCRAAVVTNADATWFDATSLTHAVLLAEVLIMPMTEGHPYEDEEDMRYAIGLTG